MLGPTCVDRLDEERDWAKVLLPVKQQRRRCLCRIPLTKPKAVFL